MDPKTIAALALLLTTDVEDSLKHGKGDFHTHPDMERPIQNLNARVLYLISGKVPVYDTTDATLVTDKE
jgi:hypothetical protein